MSSALSQLNKPKYQTIIPQAISKQKLISQLKNHLKQKVRLDQQVKQSLYQQQLKTVQKQRKIQKQLQLINKQNEVWMNEMNSFVKTIEKKKINIVLSKQAKEQIDLMRQMQHLQQELKKIKLTKQYREKVEKQDWVQLDREKQKIAVFLTENKKKLINLARAKSTQIPTRKSLSQQKVVIPKQDQSKKPRKSKNIQQLKQLGRKYLQFAKKAQKSKSQRRLLKIQNKNIDYQSQMKQLIKMKVDDLSKKPQIVLQETMSSRKKKLFKNTLGSTGSMKLSSHEGFIRGNKSLSENKMRNNSFVKGKDSLPLIKNMSIN